MEGQSATTGNGVLGAPVAGNACSSYGVVDLLRLLHLFVVLAVVLVVLFCCKEVESQRSHEETAAELTATPRLPAGARGSVASIKTTMLSRFVAKKMPRPTRPTKGKGRAEAEGAGTAAQTAADLALNRRAPRTTVLWPRIPPSGCHRGAGGCEGPKEGDPRHSSAPRCDVWRRAAPPRPRFNREAMREGLPPFGCH